MNNETQIAKKLSRNDTGESGGHQSGILIPKKEEILSFFPYLDKAIYNPRVSIFFLDENHKRWLFNFIYYNNRFFGGTRNEYRLTGMTSFFREYLLKAGDAVILSKNTISGGFSISFIKHKENDQEKIDPFVLRLGNRWTTIKIEKF